MFSFFLDILKAIDHLSKIMSKYLFYSFPFEIDKEESEKQRETYGDEELSFICLLNIRRKKTRKLKK